MDFFFVNFLQAFISFHLFFVLPYNYIKTEIWCITESDETKVFNDLFYDFIMWLKNFCICLHVYIFIFNFIYESYHVTIILWGCTLRNCLILINMYVDEWNFLFIIFFNVRFIRIDFNFLISLYLCFLHYRWNFIV